MKPSRILNLVRQPKAFHRLCRLFLSALLPLLAFAAQADAFADTHPEQAAVFGPKTYTVGSSITDSFNLPQGVPPPCILQIDNGQPGGKNRMREATVTLNDRIVLSKANFTGDALSYSIKTDLADANRIHVVVPAAASHDNDKNSIGQFTLTLQCTRALPKPTDLTPDPLKLGVGATGNLTAQLAPPPTAAGDLALTSSDSHIATVPASLPFTAGQTKVTVPVSALRAGKTSVTASLNGHKTSAAVRIKAARPATVTSLLPSHLILAQGARGNLVVTLSAAQNRKTEITLRVGDDNRDRDRDIVAVPKEVSIPAGQTSVTLPVTASFQKGVTSITASVNGSRATSQVTVTSALPAVVSLLPVTNVVTLGANISLTLTLSSAQSKATVIPLTASPSGVVSLPATITVPAGQTSVALPVSAVGFGQASIAASLNGGSATGVVQVIPLPPRVAALEPGAYTMAVGADSLFTVTLNAVQPDNTDVALAVDQPTLLQTPPSVTIVAGETRAGFIATGLAVGDATLTASLGGQQQTARIHISPQPASLIPLTPNPLALQQGATGMLTVGIDVAQEEDVVIAVANASPTIVSAPDSLTLPAGQTLVALPVTALAAGTAKLSATLNGAGQSATVQVMPPPPVVSALIPATLTLPKGRSGVLRVGLNRAPNAPLSIALASAAPTIAAVPQSVVIPAGALFADIPVTPLTEGQAGITASLNGGTVGAIVTVAPAELIAISLAPDTPVAYANDTFFMAANGLYTDGTLRDITGQTTWRTSDVGIATIDAGGAVSTLAPGTATLTAVVGFTNAQGAPATVTQTTLLTVNAATALALSAPAATLTVGESQTITVTSPDPASAQGLVVTLTATGGLSVPPSVQIPAGATSATFTVSAATAGAATLSAAAPGRYPGSLALTVVPVSSAPRITALTLTGPVGSPVTIQGNHFAVNPADNDVRFNGERATVALANATELKVIVPVKATTGLVTVTTSQGVGTSASPFTVQSQQDFDLSATPASVLIPRGGNSGIRVKLVSTGLADYGMAVNLNVTGLPPGIAWRADPPKLTRYTSATVTLSAAAEVAPGDYTLSLEGNGPLDLTRATRSQNITLTVLPADATTVSGRVLHADDDSPFVGARIRLNGLETYTDAAGGYRFVNPGILGDQVILIDGHTNNSATTAYPSAIAMPVMIIAGQDNAVLTSYIQAIDIAKSMAIVPGQAVNVTNPDLPNYALNIPQGAVLTGWDGKPIDKVSVRTVPVDKLPIKPVPAGINAKTVYLYYFFREGGATPSQPIPVTMMNDMGALPGEKADLWYYDESVTPDPDSNQWRIMGQGTVSDDGKSIVSDPGVGIPKFCCGATVASPPPPPNPPAPPPNPPTPTPDSDAPAPPAPSAPPGPPAPPSPPEPPPPPGPTPPPDPPQPPNPPTPEPPPDPSPCSANPVIYGTGASLVMRNPILGMNALLSVNLACRYNSLTDRIGPFGRGTYLNTEWQLSVSGPSMVLMSPAGIRWMLAKEADGIYHKVPGLPGIEGAEGTTNGATSVVRFRDGSRYEFAYFARGNQLLVAQTDASGNRITIGRSTGSGAAGLVQSVTDSAGRMYRIDYIPGNLISRITDPGGRMLTFYYDNALHLVTVSDPMGNATSYAWDEFNSLVKKTDPLGAVTQYVYNSDRRALREILPDDSEYRFAYTVAGNQVMETRIVNPRGILEVQRYNGQGYWTRQVDGEGNLRTRKLDPSTQFPLYQTDALGRVWYTTYDAHGNRSSIRDPQGNLTQYNYDPLFEHLTEVIDALGQSTRYAYDSKGRLIAATDITGGAIRYTYTDKGVLAGFTDALNHTTTFEHDSEGKIIAAIDPLGRRNENTYDTLGRIDSQTNPRGETTRFAYDDLDRLTKITDPQQGVTQFAYDANSRLIAVTDPLGRELQRNTYDLRGRLTARRDALGASSSAQYDANGNVTQTTNRRGQITRYGYDANDRLNHIEDADGRTTDYSYDPVGRPVHISDNISGDILLQYGILNVPTRIITDQGTLDYQYDRFGRRTQMRINGTDTVDYVYDTLGRLIRSSFRGKDASYTYDAIGKLTQKTLPNGIRQTYSYDEANRLLSIEYRKADGALIETISHTYDANGNITVKGQSVDSAPETPFSAKYDTGNRLTQITFNPGSANAATYNLTYDASGYLIKKSHSTDAADITTYTWDAKGRLAGLTSPNLQAGYRYDALGRRIEKTVNGQSVGYLYDGNQAIAELVGSSVSAAYHPGVQIDEILARYTTSGQKTLLQDALGSVIAQTAEDGDTVNRYVYSPYGESRTIGADDGNPLQYTGRENDGTGLYYYRARYYDPLLKRFISEDPIGLAGGINVYGYVGGNPVGFRDPNGLFLSQAIGAGIGIGIGIGIGVTIANSIQNSSKPPSGSKPIDETPWSGDHGRIKGDLGLGGKGNVKISPGGEVWVENPDGTWGNHGSAEDYTGSGKASGRSGKDRDKRGKGSGCQ